MKRLTVKRPDGRWAIAMSEGEKPRDQFEKIPKVIDRLAAYEDTGLEPEEIREVQAALAPIPFGRFRDIMEAERAGRLVVLPCKVGDTVYIPNITNCSREAIAARVQGISISVSGRTILRFGGYPFESAWGDGCGKDWFLTREEAERALEEGGSDA